MCCAARIGVGTRGEVSDTDCSTARGGGAAGAGSALRQTRTVRTRRQSSSGSNNKHAHRSAEDGANGRRMGRPLNARHSHFARRATFRAMPWRRSRTDVRSSTSERRPSEPSHHNQAAAAAAAINRKSITRRKGTSVRGGCESGDSRHAMMHGCSALSAGWVWTHCCPGPVSV